MKNRTKPFDRSFDNPFICSSNLCSKPEKSISRFMRDTFIHEVQKLFTPRYLFPPLLQNKIETQVTI